MHHRPEHLLVTGAAGFIGFHVLEHLVCGREAWMQSIQSITAVDRLDYSSQPPSELASSPNKLRDFTFLQADITSPEHMLKILTEFKIDTVLHLAAQTHVDNSFGNSFTFTLSNVLGTHVLLESCKLLGSQIQRFLHVSTDEVYGDNNEHKPEFVETDPCEPTNPYSATKTAAEAIVKAYHRSFKLPVLIARPNNVYGPRQFPEKVIPKFIRQLQSNQPLTIHGQGTAQRSFLHVFDVVSALVDYILIQGVPGEVYNVGGSKVRSILQVAKDLQAIWHQSGSPLHGMGFCPDRAYNDQRYDISSHKLTNTLLWPGPQIAWEDGLRRTVEWYRAHPLFWPNELEAIVPHPRLGAQDRVALL
ncbi:dTDP-glucose 4,6-dehydratase [Batrachochytrium salamandrivorans]|nr:dTDP-glucose 4,6-dehydratase [Batrachochytrium salamandrivorans]